jgi:hypothetical protein
MLSKLFCHACYLPIGHRKHPNIGRPHISQALNGSTRTHEFHGLIRAGDRTIENILYLKDTL